MNSLDRFMEFFVAAVFLCVGSAKILRYNRRPRPLGAAQRRLPFGLPYGFIVAVGLLEIAAALALVAPFGAVSSATLVLIAATGLALLTAAAGIFRARHQESAAPAIALFLLAVFVIVGRAL